MDRPFCGTALAARDNPIDCLVKLLKLFDFLGDGSRMNVAG